MRVILSLILVFSFLTVQITVSSNSIINNFAFAEDPASGEEGGSGGDSSLDDPEEATAGLCCYWDCTCGSGAQKEKFLHSGACVIPADGNTASSKCKTFCVNDGGVVYAVAEDHYCN